MKLSIQLGLLFSLVLSSTATYSFESLAEAGTVQRVRVNFTSPEGNIRPLLLGFTTDDAATDGYDYGYDARNVDSYPNDLNWIIEGERFVIQGVGRYEDYKYYEFGMYLDETGDVKISLSALENFDTEIPVYIFDAVIGDFTQINDSAFVRYLEPGTYNKRFYLAFSNNNATLGEAEKSLDEQIQIFTEGPGKIVFNSAKNNLIESIQLYSINGKMIRESFNISSESHIMHLQDLNNKPLILYINTENGSISKIIVVPDI